MIVPMPATVAGLGGDAVLDVMLERVTFAKPGTGYTIAPEWAGTELITAAEPLLQDAIARSLVLAPSVEQPSGTLNPFAALFGEGHAGMARGAPGA